MRLKYCKKMINTLDDWHSDVSGIPAANRKPPVGDARTTEGATNFASFKACSFEINNINNLLFIIRHLYKMNRKKRPF